MTGLVMKKVRFVMLFIFYVWDVTHGFNTLPEDNENIGPPTCTSSNSLCGLDYRVVNGVDKTVTAMHSNHKICACPDSFENKCSVVSDWKNMNNSVVQRLLSGPGNQLLVKITYCKLPAPKRDCRMNDPVLVTRGRGPLMFDIVDDMMCRCDRPLVAQSSWLHGEYDYVLYGCGQPRCIKRDRTVCGEVTNDDNSLKSRSFCRCKRQEICSGDLPKLNGETVEHKCLKINTNSTRALRHNL